MSDRPIDIVRSTLTPQLWHKTPYLVCNVELKNDMNVGKYLFPGLARLEIFGELVGFAMATPESPGSHRGAQWGATWQGAGINQARFYWGEGTSRQVYCCFQISAMVLNSLASSFEGKDVGPYRVDLELPVVEEYSMMVRKDQSGAVSQETVARPSEGILAHVEGQAKIYEWREWMKAWGAACEAIYLPTQLMNQLRTIKPTMGVGFEWEVISELVRCYQGAGAEAILVTSDDEIQKRMAEVIGSANKELLMMCRAFDETLFPAITEAQDRGVVVKIVTVSTQRLKLEKYPEIRRLEEALRKTSGKVQVKTNQNQHARVIVSEGVALVGSTDPDYYGLKVHKNASIYTTNPTIVNAARLFFESVWQESESAL